MKPPTPLSLDIPNMCYYTAKGVFDIRGVGVLILWVGIIQDFLELLKLGECGDLLPKASALGFRVLGFGV